MGVKGDGLYNTCMKCDLEEDYDTKNCANNFKWIYTHDTYNMKNSDACRDKIGLRNFNGDEKDT